MIPLARHNFGYYGFESFDVEEYEYTQYPGLTAMPPPGQQA
jgi:hypothetical protein